MADAATLATITAPNGRTRRAPSRRLVSPVLVGREHELSVLRQAATSPPAVAIVEGEAGVGKTRLVRELLARPEARGRTALVGYCQQLRAVPVRPDHRRAAHRRRRPSRAPARR